MPRPAHSGSPALTALVSSPSHPPPREETLLQAKLQNYAEFIGKFGLAAAAAVLVGESARFRCGGQAGRSAGSDARTRWQRRAAAPVLSCRQLTLLHWI